MVRCSELDQNPVLAGLVGEELQLEERRSRERSVTSGFALWNTAARGLGVRFELPPEALRIAGGGDL